MRSSQIIFITVIHKSWLMIYRCRGKANDQRTPIGVYYWVSHMASDDSFSLSDVNLPSNHRQVILRRRWLQRPWPPLERRGSCINSSMRLSHACISLTMYIHVYTCIYMYIHVYTCLNFCIKLYTYMNGCW